MKKRLLAIALCIGMIFAMSACGKPSPTDVANQFMEAIKTQDTTTMDKVYADEEGIDLSGTMNEVADEEGDDIAESDNEADDKKDVEDLDDMDKMTKAMCDKMLEFDYEISNEKIDGDKATVDVKVTTYPIGEGFVGFFEDYMSQAFDLAFSGASEEDIDALGVKLMKKMVDGLTEKSFTKTAQLSMTKDKDGNWIVDKVDETTDFYDAITGGMISTMDALNNEMMEQND